MYLVKIGTSAEFPRLEAFIFHSLLFLTMFGISVVGLTC